MSVFNQYKIYNETHYLDESSMNALKKPNVFAYNNFREFLSDYYNFRSVEDPNFTKAFICRELGLPNTRSFFNDILRGKNITPVKLPLLVKLLELSKEESQYFRVLVNFNQSTDPDEKELLLDQLISLNRTPKEIVPPSVYAYYKEWHHSAVRAIINTFDFSDDYKLLSRMVMPSITAKQARESIRLLKQLRLIKKNEQGFYKPTAKVITTGAVAKDDIIKQYQSKTIEVARAAIFANHNQPKRVLTKVLSFSEDAYKQIEKRFNKFNAEITSIVHKDEKAADRVYHLDVMLFPIRNKE